MTDAEIVLLSANECVSLFDTQAQTIGNGAIGWGRKLPVSEPVWSGYYQQRVPADAQAWWSHRVLVQDKFVGYVWVDDKLPHFAGHFPTDPVLPGIVQLDWALAAVEESRDGAMTFAGMSNVKFKARVLPRVWLRLELDFSPGSVRCAYYGDGGLCTQASLQYRD